MTARQCQDTETVSVPFSTLGSAPPCGLPDVSSLRIESALGKRMTPFLTARFTVVDRQALYKSEVASVGWGITSALGPMKMSPSRAPAMTRTCLGLPTLEKTAERNAFYLRTDTEEHSPDTPMYPLLLHLSPSRKAQLIFTSFLIHFSIYIKSMYYLKLSACYLFLLYYFINNTSSSLFSPMYIRWR